MTPDAKSAQVRASTAPGVPLTLHAGEADEGLRVEAEGNWVTHPAFGPQFRLIKTTL